MSGNHAIQAVIVDVGGVVIHVHEQRTVEALKKACPADAARILQAINYASAIARGIYTGRRSLRQEFDDRQAELGLTLTYEQFVSAWMEMLGADISGVRQALHALPNSVPLYAFSNTIPEHMDVLRKHWLFSRSRRFFASCEIGLCKPDADSYRHVLDCIGLPADRVLFLDDNAANIAAAEALGIVAVQVTGPTVLPDTLRQMGLID